MEKVFEWLSKSKLGRYSPIFNENAWDNLSLIPYMTDEDLDICITTRGDIARFKKSCTESFITVNQTKSDDDARLLYETSELSPCRQSSADTLSDSISGLTILGAAERESIIDRVEHGHGGCGVQIHSK